MRIGLALLGSVALLIAPAQAQKARGDRFAAPIYTGPRAQPDFTGSGSRFARVQTRIREAFVTGSIAAGHYIVLQVGCGSGCTWNIVGDVRTGRLMDFPVGGEEYQGVDILTERKSKLFIGRWGDVGFSTCTTRKYLLEAGRFVQLEPDAFENKSCFD